MRTANLLGCRDIYLRLIGERRRYHGADENAETVLAAVNLGDDTDTTGAVTGGLAGLYYGEAAIPPEWLAALARRADIEALTAAAELGAGVS